MNQVSEADQQVLDRACKKDSSKRGKDFEEAKRTVSFVRMTDSCEPTSDAFRMPFNLRKLDAVLPNVLCELFSDAILKSFVRELRL